MYHLSKISCKASNLHFFASSWFLMQCLHKNSSPFIPSHPTEDSSSALLHWITPPNKVLALQFYFLHSFLGSPSYLSQYQRWLDSFCWCWGLWKNEKEEAINCYFNPWSEKQRASAAVLKRLLSHSHREKCFENQAQNLVLSVTELHRRLNAYSETFQYQSQDFNRKKGKPEPSHDICVNKPKNIKYSDTPTFSRPTGETFFS